MSYYGLVMGAVLILAIGFGHVMVVRWEYYWGHRSWSGLLVLGSGCAVGSLFIDNAFLSGVMGIFAAVFLWSIHELFKQPKRVEDGLFPKNPKKK